MTPFMVRNEGNDSMGEKWKRMTVWGKEWKGMTQYRFRTEGNDSLGVIKAMTV